MRRVIAPAVVAVAAHAARGITSQGLQSSVVDAIVKSPQGKLFDPKRVQSGTAEFLDLGFDATYTSAFSPEVIAHHVNGYLAAKAQTPEGEKLRFQHEGEKEAYFFCHKDAREQHKVMRAIDAYAATRTKLLETHALSVRSYASASDCANGMVLYTVDLHQFKNPGLSKNGATLEELTTNEFLALRSEKAKQRYTKVLHKMESAFRPVYSITDTGNGVLALNIALYPDRASYMGLMTSLITQASETSCISSKFCESFSNGVQVYSFYVRGATKDQLSKAASLVGQLPNRPGHALTDLFNKQELTPEEVIYGYSVICFAYYYTPPAVDENFLELARHVKKDAVQLKRLTSMRNNLFQEIMSEGAIAEHIHNNVDLFKQLYADFAKGSTEASAAALDAAIQKAFVKSPIVLTLFQTMLTFNKAVKATNFFKADNSAIAYRLDPAFLKGLDYGRVPYGVYMLTGAQFRGFHVRFHDICRGGVRMLLPVDELDYKQKKKTLFQENYNLAFTQMLKNKDIPESGSKGTLLVSTRFKGTNRRKEQMQGMFMQYCDALLDVMKQEPGVRFNLPQNELLFLGPDENTAGDYPSAAAHLAKDRGFTQWKTLTTGKKPTDGGIPHDTYGMTTQSVRECLEGVYRKLDLDQTKLTKFQTGGPNGDLGANEILMGLEKYIGISDLGGCVHDPAGIDREELLRLVKEKKQLDHFDVSKLSAKGFYVPYKENINVKLPDGTVVTDGKLFLSDFHFSKYTGADVFVPCGGRPRSVTLDNVHQFLLNAPTVKGEQMLEGSVKVTPDQLKYKYIVEGANLFITHDARLALENCGVCLFKDATANKGGVTSSSLEIYSGLALSDEEHATLMCGPEENLPEFYKKMVQEIIVRVRANARAEFEAVWKDARAGFCEGKHTLVSDELSGKVVKIVEFIAASKLHENDALFRYVLNEYTPATLKGKVPLDVIMQRVPHSYLRAIFEKTVACDYVYSTGVAGNEFSFFQFMHALEKKAQAWSAKQ